MTAIENSGLLSFCFGCLAVGFSPSVQYAFDPEDKTLTITDNSLFPAGDTLEKINITVTDRATGVVKTAQISVAGGNVEIDLSALNGSQGYNVSVTVVTESRQVADLAAWGIASPEGANSGVIGNVNPEEDPEVPEDPED